MLRSLAKAENIARVLKDTLEFRISKMADFNQVDIKRDANSWPIVVVTTDGNEAAGEPAIKARIESVDGASEDIFNNPRKAYTPHTVTVLFEEDAVKAGDLILITNEILNQECGALIRQTAAATAIVDAELETAPIVGDYDNLDWPTKNT